MYSLRIKWLWLSISLVLLSGIVYLSLVPSNQLPGLKFNDKFLHFSAYFFLTSWFVGFIKTRWYWLIAIVLVLFSYGIEELQGMSRWRQFEWYDVFANAGGVLFGLILGAMLLKGWSVHFEDKFFKAD